MKSTPHDMNRSKELRSEYRDDRELTPDERMVLDAYVDRQATPEEHQHALALLNSLSAAWRYVDTCRRQNELLKTLYGSALSEPLPQRLRSLIG